MEYKIGLDLSLNNSGLCIKWGDKIRFAQLRPERDKPHASGSVEALSYEKWMDNEYSTNELFKVQNAQRQMKAICAWVLKYLIAESPSKILVCVETPPTRIMPGRTNSHLDLIRANGIVTSGLMMILQSKFDCEIVWSFISNSTIKKCAGVKGRGSLKGEIVDAFLASDDLPEFFDNSDKIDDIADAYFAMKTL